MVSRENLVNRLRKSIVESRESSWSKGFEVGRDWAANAAEGVELERLEIARESYAFWDRYLADMSSCCEEVFLSQLLESIIRPEAKVGFDGDDDDDFEKFWEPIIGTDLRPTGNHDWLVGFADGAISVWDSVADDVRNYQMRTVGVE